MPKINLRKILLKEMKKRKLSIPAMSRTIGCNQQTLYDFFAGRKALGADYLQAVLNQLGATIKFSIESLDAPKAEKRKNIK